MERLIEKHDLFGYLLPVNDIWGITQATQVDLVVNNSRRKKPYIVGSAIRQLGKLEDLLEKYNVESVEELDLILQSLEKVHKENAYLKNELAELKQRAIVPKYNIKQHIWLARNNEFQKEPCELIVRNVEYKFKTDDFIYIVDFVEKGHHKSINMCDNGDLFATKEEAEQKLAEIGGKDETTK